MVNDGDDTPQFDSYTVRRLGIRQGHRVAIFNAPTGYREALEEIMPSRSRILHLHELANGEKVNAALIWPESVGLFEQSLRELGGHIAPEFTAWVILDTEGFGLLERSVSREQIVNSALAMGFQDSGMKSFSPGHHVLRLVSSEPQGA